MNTNKRRAKFLSNTPPYASPISDLASRMSSPSTFLFVHSSPSGLAPSAPYTRPQMTIRCSLDMPTVLCSRRRIPSSISSSGESPVLISIHLHDLIGTTKHSSARLDQVLLSKCSRAVHAWKKGARRKMA